MSRPGFVLEVDERTPPLLVHEGEGFRLERFPLGTQVIYPPDAVPGVPDLDAAVDAALAGPEGSAPLAELLTPGTKLTIVFNDLSVPTPPMAAPDIRSRIIEAVLEVAAATSVDDVELIAATGLRRRLTPAELRSLVGDRIYASFHPDHLRCHDAEDRATLTLIGSTDEGEDVEVNTRVADSDLVVFVNVNVGAVTGGALSCVAGLLSAASSGHLYGVPGGEIVAGALPDAGLRAADERMAALLEAKVKVFRIDSTLDNSMFPSRLSFVDKREWEWSLRDQGAFLAAQRANSLTPAKLRHRLWHNLRAPYRVTGITSGEPGAIRTRTLAQVDAQQRTEVSGQSDIAVFGLPYSGPYSVNSITNPVLVAGLGLGEFFNAYRGRPLVRRGGVVILYHPVPLSFHPVHHPSYIDFYDEVLAGTTDPSTLSQKFEKQFAQDEWYRHLYRNSYAFHGVHPFHVWYRACRARDYVGDVICVGADRQAAARLGFRTASTLADALEMATGSVGRSPRIAYLHNPPRTLADVR
ncbi:MAG: lactate racemase domain-containing protein [Mycobacteriales bacterium]